MEKVYSPAELDERARRLFEEERKIDNLMGWFLSREIAFDAAVSASHRPPAGQAALSLLEIARKLPLSLSENAVFAGTQRDAFARSYALINPAFRVESFSGYCDPTAVYDDIAPDADISEERIEAMRQKTKQSKFVRELSETYTDCADETSEVLYFVEQVTGHVIPDFRPALKMGTKKLANDLNERIGKEYDPIKKANLSSMQTALQAAEIFAGRYRAIAEEQLSSASGARKVQLELLVRTLGKVPANSAENLFEAIQSFILLWQCMCIEQAPNPFAFSVGNADRIFEPYRNGLPRETAAGLLKHFLAFFNVGDRSWAISQNVIAGGRGTDGNDLTSITTYALLDAYFEMNLPQPILSVKLHQNTPDELYRQLGKFWFSPGMLTPSLFNDDALFDALSRAGIDRHDLPDAAIAGCQEPLIMGKDNGNTTNSWLNLPKVLELTLTGGKSLLTGKVLNGLPKAQLKSIRKTFYRNLKTVTKRMVKAANGASRALSNLKTPFLSVFMGGCNTGYDLRDADNQGTKYNGSGCLIHGLSVISDSFIAIDELLKTRPEDAPRLLPALKNNWIGYEDLREFLKSASKYGNGELKADKEAAAVASKVARLVRKQKNYLGNNFRPDFSSPTTHLLYGYWVGATPDGRACRDMLGYGIDPLYGEAKSGLGLRLLSNFRLPFRKFCGGYASHLGIDPKEFKAETLEDKGLEFRNKIINTLFFNPAHKGHTPFYVYFNITTAQALRKVLSNPKEYAPSGVYIMRIHGTFVNFLDLSPQIQEDIIARLDPASTKLGG